MQNIILYTSLSVNEKCIKNRIFVPVRVWTIRLPVKSVYLKEKAWFWIIMYYLHLHIQLWGLCDPIHPWHKTPGVNILWPNLHLKRAPSRLSHLTVKSTKISIDSWRTYECVDGVSIKARITKIISGNWARIKARIKYIADLQHNSDVLYGLLENRFVCLPP